MHDYILKEMANNLETAGLLAPTVGAEVSIDKVVDCLGKSWKDRMAVVWCIEDVLVCAKCLHADEPWMSEDEAREILQSLSQNHDCNHGVSNGTLSYYVNALKKTKGVEASEN